MPCTPDRLVRKLLSLGPTHVVFIAVTVGSITAAVFASGLAGALHTFPFYDTVASLTFGILVAALPLSILWAVELRQENRRREHTERSLEQSERQLRTLIDAVPVLIAFVDADGHICISNRAHAAWFGLCPGEVVGMSVRDLLGGQPYEDCREQIDAALSGKHITFEGLLCDARGERG